MANTLVLFNGLQLNDHPPGQTSRTKHLRPGAWVAARLLVYVFPSFPRLWRPTARAGHDARSSTFQHNWRDWVSRLEGARKDSGAWAALARFLAHRSPSISHGDVRDIACAVIELAMRDAEIELNLYRPAPKRFEAYAIRRAPGGGSEEQALMSKIRSAAGYAPRVAKIEKCIYRALVYCDATLVFRMAQGAPRDSVVRAVISR